MTRSHPRLLNEFVRRQAAETLLRESHSTAGEALLRDLTAGRFTLEITQDPSMYAKAHRVQLRQKIELTMIPVGHKSGGVRPGCNGCRTTVCQACGARRPDLAGERFSFDAVLDHKRHPSGEFQPWFAGSRAVDPDGDPLVVYHGTNEALDTFEIDEEYSRHPSGFLGIYFTASPEIAGHFISDVGEGGNIIPAYLSIRNPKEITWGEFRRQFAHENTRYAEPGDVEWDRVTERVFAFKQELEALGHDGIRVIGSRRAIDPEGQHDNWIAFDPGQIRSAVAHPCRFGRERDDLRCQVHPTSGSFLEAAWLLADVLGRALTQARLMRLEPSASQAPTYS